jgi:HSP20 family protein
MADRWRELRFPQLGTFRELSDVWSGSFDRHVQLPIPVQADRVRATYKDGGLDIRLPKVEEVTPREIKIELG